MPSVEIYTDACSRFDVHTGCTVVIGEGIPPVFITTHHPEAGGSATAEVLSAIAGLERVPRDWPIKLYTDFDPLVVTTRYRQRSGHVAYGAAMRRFFALKAACTQLEVFRVDRGAATYLHCHAQARELARVIKRMQQGDPTGSIPT